MATGVMKPPRGFVLDPPEGFVPDPPDGLVSDIPKFTQWTGDAPADAQRITPSAQRAAVAQPEPVERQEQLRRAVLDIIPGLQGNRGMTQQQAAAWKPETGIGPGGERLKRVSHPVIVPDAVTDIPGAAQFYIHSPQSRPAIEDALSSAEGVTHMGPESPDVAKLYKEMRPALEAIAQANEYAQAHPYKSAIKGALSGLSTLAKDILLDRINTGDIFTQGDRGKRIQALRDSPNLADRMAARTLTEMAYTSTVATLPSYASAATGYWNMLTLGELPLEGPSVTPEQRTMSAAGAAAGWATWTLLPMIVSSAAKSAQMRAYKKSVFKRLGLKPGAGYSKVREAFVEMASAERVAKGQQVTPATKQQIGEVFDYLAGRARGPEHWRAYGAEPIREPAGAKPGGAPGIVPAARPGAASLVARSKQNLAAIKQPAPIPVPAQEITPARPPTSPVAPKQPAVARDFGPIAEKPTPTPTQGEIAAPEPAERLGDFDIGERQSRIDLLLDERSRIIEDAVGELQDSIGGDFAQVTRQGEIDEAIAGIDRDLKHLGYGGKMESFEDVLAARGITRGPQLIEPARKTATPQVPQPPAQSKAKQPWEMTLDEWLAVEARPNTPRGVLVAGENARIVHGVGVVKQALDEGKPVPRAVLQEYAGEKWADAALAKPTEGKGAKPTVDGLVAKGKAQKKAQVKSGKIGKFLSDEAGAVDIQKVRQAGQKVTRPFWKLIQPAKLAERTSGADAVARTMQAIHGPEADVLRWHNQKLVSDEGMLFRDLKEYFSRFQPDELENFMLSRGVASNPDAKHLQAAARGELNPELKALARPLHEIADFNYKLLKKLDPDANYVDEYFYGLYKNPGKVKKFVAYWKTTSRFLKHKAFPTYADAANFGLELRDSNPVDNLSREFLAISRLYNMTKLRDDLLKTGRGKYIQDSKLAPPEWDMVEEPAFSDVRLEPELASLINGLISTNMISQSKGLSALREVNNAYRSMKFIGSGFHHLGIAKQSVADNGPMGFLNPKNWGKTIKQVFSPGFKKNDPTFQTPEYHDYIRNGGGHHYSMEAEAKDALNRWMTSKEYNAIWRTMRTPGRVISAPGRVYVNWLFERYIPRVKYMKYLDNMAKQTKKLGRDLTPAEKQSIIKEGQNFYGEMNERLFGRSATTTSALRFLFMAPGFAEGNARTIGKAMTQAEAGRSRWNIPNSLLLTAMTATVGTLILTGKAPKAPKNKDEFRDLFKIQTPWKDSREHTVYIDLLTYDKDYWNHLVAPAWTAISESPAEGAEEGLSAFIKRVGGMKAGTFDVAVDVASLAMGRAIVDWRGEKVYYHTDPALTKLNKLLLHEAEKLEPISASVARRMMKKKIAPGVALLTAMAGVRPSTSEFDKKVDKVARDSWELRDSQEMLYQRLGSISKPRKAIYAYNALVDQVLSSPYMTKELKENFETRPLKIDVNKLLRSKAYQSVNPSEDADKRERAQKYLVNFDVDDEETTRLLFETRKGAMILAVNARLAGDNKRVGEIIRRFQRKGEKRITLSSIKQSISQRRSYRLNKAARLMAQGQKAKAQKVLDEWEKGYPGAPKITKLQAEARARRYK